MAISGLITNPNSSRTDSRTDRSPVLSDSACNPSSARSSGPTYGLEEIGFALVHLHSRDKALRRFVEDHEVRGDPALNAWHSRGLHTRLRSPKCRSPRKFRDDSI